MFRLEHGALDGLGLLDLDDQGRRFEHGGGIGQDGGADGLVVAVLHADAFTRMGLDEHVVAAVGQFPHGTGNETHPVLVILDFFRYTNLHLLTPATRFAILSSSCQQFVLFIQIL